jgi:hypothetical protein
MSEKQRKRNEISRLLRTSNRNRNAFRWSTNETKSHIEMKFAICKKLKEWGHEFYTEAIFDSTGLRADVIDADEGIIYEVVNTEGVESIAKKKGLYPLEIRVVNANQKFSEELLL